ncbi:GNAT family N-acetyltransferase [Haloactinomyces albus]|uniref:GNAT family acetyltransferase n=1 Tax=Haloactinomyces albus TaxID=1352928 RepID=A0AAE3Z8S2_9ACTN|nr:GNAT family N-acetyltransferase [Haloactinomyces albus]MDR7300423.1 putative GNAT family acetyltransferase [Haloactinomyces albus]
MQPTPEVIDNPDRSRFELYSGEELIGFAEYRTREQTIDFVHTEVDSRFKGRGLGTQLVGTALEAARLRDAAVVPHCWFVRDWIAEHPDYRDLVPERLRPEFDL